MNNNVLKELKETPSIQYLSYDQWQSKPVTEVEAGDYLLHQCSIYVASGPTVFDDENSTWRIDAKPFDEKIILDIGGEPGREFIPQAMDILMCDSIAFEDGTEMLVDNLGRIYSPRMQPAELNEYCEVNLAKFKELKAQEEEEGKAAMLGLLGALKNPFPEGIFPEVK